MTLLLLLPLLLPNFLLGCSKGETREITMSKREIPAIDEAAPAATAMATFALG